MFENLKLFREMFKHPLGYAIVLSKFSKTQNKRVEDLMSKTDGLYFFGGIDDAYTLEHVSTSGERSVEFWVQNYPYSFASVAFESEKNGRPSRLNIAKMYLWMQKFDLRDKFSPGDYNSKWYKVFDVDGNFVGFADQLSDPRIITEDVEQPVEEPVVSPGTE